MDNREYCRKYYKKNRQKILNNRSEKVTCIGCGDVICRSSLSKHVKTKLHKKRCELRKRELRCDVERVVELYEQHNGDKEKVMSSLINES